MKKLKTFISKLKTIWQIKKVKILYDLLAIFQYLLLIAIAWFFERVLEMITMVPLFFIFRSKYSKQIHAKTLLLCAIYSLGIFFIIISIIPSNQLSILVCVISMGLLTTISYFAKDYVDKTKLLKKKLESMSLEEMKEKYTNRTEYEINCVYEYINRGNNKADNIALKYGYSTRQIQRIIKSIRDE